MAREQKGFVTKDREGRWTARFTYTDQAGKRRNVKKRVATKTEGREFLRERIRELDARGPRAMDSAASTFEDRARFYSATYLVPAEYVDDRKVSGLRTYETGLIHVKTLKAHFGSKRLRDLTYAQLEAFRALRLKTPTVHERPRSIASVNRELALLRNMLNVAVREGWLGRNPFNAGRPLINVADERRRQRVVTREEEVRLLAACTSARAPASGRYSLPCSTRDVGRASSVSCVGWTST